MAKANWLTISPMPYFEDLFSKLALDITLDLQVYYVARQLAAYPLEASSGMSYGTTFLDTGLAKIRLLIDIYLKRDATWVVGGWGTPIYSIALVMLAVLRRRYIIFTDTPIPNGRSSRLATRVVRVHLLRLWFRRAYLILGTGELAVSKLKEMGAPAKSLVNYPYPLDEKRFAVERHAHRENDLVFLCTGRLSIRDKRFDLAIRAFAMFASSSSRTVRLRIAGSGPDEGMLRELAAACGVSQMVDFVGWVRQEDLPRFYSSGDIYLHPADFEPYGVTLGEALLSGLFAVSNRHVGSAVELIESGVNGVFFKAGDLDSLALALGEAMEAISTPSYSRENVRQKSLKWPLDRSVSEISAYLGHSA